MLGNFDLSQLSKMSLAEQQALANSLTDEEAEAIERYVEYRRVPIAARKDVLKFAQFIMPDPEHYQDAKHSSYVIAPHHRLLAEALEKVLRGECLRLAISMPPQFGKSQLGTRTFIPFHIGRFPWKHLLCTAYNQTFAEEFGEEVRNIILGKEFGMVFPHVKLRGGSKAKDHMVTERGAKINFAGLRGSIAGRPADGIVIDDPTKNRAEAESKAFRDDVWGGYTGVVNARCHALTWQIIISTRWNEDDLIGRLTDPKNPHYKPEVAKQWTVINLPAMFIHPDDDAIASAMGMKRGDALWPERFPIHLLETAKSLDEYNFSALYMGRPTPPEGAFYKQADITTYSSWGELPKHGRFYLTGDLAVSPEMHADRSACGIWLLDKEDTLWLHPDLYWDRKSSDESVNKIIEMCKRYKTSDAWFEKGQLDRAIGPFLEKRLAEEGANWVNVSRLPVNGNKGVRSLSIRGRMRQGKVRFPDFAPWWPAAKEELLKFTGSGNDKADDFCDMVALIGQALEDQVVASVPSANVVKFPKPGTLGWTRWAADRERRFEKARKALKGM